MKKLIISYITIIFVASLSFILLVGFTSLALEWEILLFLGTLLVVVGSALFAVVALRYQNRLKVIIQGMSIMLSSKAGRVQGFRPMAVESEDEIGQVAIAFNKLQEHFINEYKEVDREIALAHQIQQKLLPPVNNQGGQVQIATFFRPMKEVGGDLYDILPLGKHRFALAIGDVSGKGLPAALLMSTMILLLRTEITQGGSPGEIITRLNRHVFETMGGDMYVTLALAIIDEQRLTLDYASAGHVSPYLIRNQALKQILTSTLPLGITAEESYSTIHLSMERGDRLFLYTDGIVEAFISQDEMLGFERLETYLLELSPEDSLETQMSILMEKVERERVMGHEDDRTAMMLHWI